MNFQILQCAEDEIADGMDYYNDQCPGLGYEFAYELKEGMQRIRSYPEAWSPFVENIRVHHIFIR